MFRRRDVAEMLPPEFSGRGEDLVQEAASALEHETAETLPSRAPARKMTLADHFADQARPTGSGQPQPRKFDKARPPVIAEPRTARASAESEEDGKNKRMLTVGPQTCMKGEISRCDRVMIEGEVDAEMADVDLLEISEDGVFRGTAKVGNAEISGRFDGDLTVVGRLVIYEKGLVNGKISYGEIQVMRGGRIVGEIRCPEVKESVRESTVNKAKAVA